MQQESTPAPKEDPATAMVMPGSAEENREKIAAVSPEGRPGDPKSGPGTLYLLLVMAALGVTITVAIIAPWIGWPAAVMTLGFGIFAFAVNPEVFATFQRAKDRREVLDHDAREHRPDGS